MPNLGSSRRRAAINAFRAAYTLEYAVHVGAAERILASQIGSCHQYVFAFVVDRCNIGGSSIEGIKA